jgi:membrane protein implicated in regulation of membrane protease activity
MTPAAIIMLGVVLVVVELGAAAYLLDVPGLWILLVSVLAIAAAALLVARRATRPPPDEPSADSSGARR